MPPRSVATSARPSGRPATSEMSRRRAVISTVSQSERNSSSIITGDIAEHLHAGAAARQKISHLRNVAGRRRERRGTGLPPAAAGHGRCRHGRGGTNREWPRRDRTGEGGAPRPRRRRPCSIASLPADRRQPRRDLIRQLRADAAEQALRDRRSADRRRPTRPALARRSGRRRSPRPGRRSSGSLPSRG